MGVLVDVFLVKRFLEVQNIDRPDASVIVVVKEPESQLYKSDVRFILLHVNGLHDVVEPKDIDVVHFGLTFRLHKQLIEPNRNFFVIVAKNLLKISYARASVHMDDERVILRLFRNIAKSVKGSE